VLIQNIDEVTRKITHISQEIQSAATPEQLTAKKSACESIVAVLKALAGYSYLPSRSEPSSAAVGSPNPQVQRVLERMNSASGEIIAKLVDMKATLKNQPSSDDVKQLGVIIRDVKQLL